MQSTRRSDPSSAARPREPTRPVSPVAPRSERKRCRRPQTASAPCGRPRQTRHASDGSCRRPAKEPAPLARSSGHRRATPAHWLAEPTDASPTHRAPARSVQNVHLTTRSQGESSPQTNPTQPAWQELFAFPMSRGIPFFDPLLQLALSTELLDTVNSYLGLNSRLNQINFWYTIPLEKPDRIRIASQNWHRDPEG